MELGGRYLCFNAENRFGKSLCLGKYYFGGNRFAISFSLPAAATDTPRTIALLLVGFYYTKRAHNNERKAVASLWVITIVGIKYEADAPNHSHNRGST